MPIERLNLSNLIKDLRTLQFYHRINLFIDNFKKCKIYHDGSLKIHSKLTNNI